MYTGRLISSDDHVFEPPDVWTSRLGEELGERAPHVVREEDADWWVCGDYKLMSLGPGTQTGQRFEDPEKLRLTGRLEDVRLGGYLPDERVKDMDTDGVEVTVIYPSVGLSLYNLSDSGLLTVLLSAYNDWLAEFCQASPKRLKGVALLNVDDVPAAAKELERCAKMGLASGMISTYPPEGRGYFLADYEPLWAAAQDLEVPLGLHFGTNRPGPGQTFGDAGLIRPSFVANVDHWVRMSLGDIIFSGVLERYPRLRVGSIEHELAWAPHFLERIDYTFTQRPRKQGRYKFKNAMKPSDFFHRNCFVSFQQDATGIRLRDIIGVGNMVWGSDYPHIESTFPQTRQILDRILEGCTGEEKNKIVFENTVSLYHLD